MDFHPEFSMRVNERKSERKCVKIMDKFEIYLKWTLSTLLLTELKGVVQSVWIVDTFLTDLSTIFQEEK
jgi:hypothetical protein